MKSLKKLYIAWKRENFSEFKKQLRTISIKSYESITVFLEKNFDELYIEKNIVYQELIINWLKNYKATNKGQYEYFINKIFNSEKHIKEKNETYLKVCSKFSEFRSAQFMPHSLTEYWPEGLRVFTSLILHKFSPEDRQSYLVEMFSCVTPESNKIIKEIFLENEIKSVLQTQKDKAGNNLFWAENWSASCSFSDSNTLYLLKWSENYGFGLAFNQNVDEYINSKNTDTLEYIINMFGVDNILNHTLPLIESKITQITDEKYKKQRQEELNLLKPQLFFYKMKNDLPETNKISKSIKI